MKKVCYKVKTYVPWKILMCTDNAVNPLGTKWMKRVRKSLAGKDKIIIRHAALDKSQLNLFSSLFASLNLK